MISSFSGSAGGAVRSALALMVGGIPRGLLTGAEDKRPVEDSWEEFGRDVSCFELVVASDVTTLCDRDVSCLVLVETSGMAALCARFELVSSLAGSLVDTEVVLLENGKSSLCSLWCVLLDDERDEVGRGISCWLW